MRHIARKRASQLFDLCAGFVYSQVLLACVRLRLLQMLEAGPRPVESLAQQARVPPEAMRTLLHAAAALGLTQWRGGAGQCGLGVHGAALLGNPGLLPLIEHHSLLYADLQDPLAVLRGTGEAGQLARYWAYAGAAQAGSVTQPQVAPYSALMSASQGLVARAILDAFPLEGHRSLLDVGGGDGHFAAMAAARVPSLQVTCFDLEPVTQLAQARFAAAGLGERARVVAGNFHDDALPEGADVISLIRVLHDHGDAQALRLLRAAYTALPHGGTLLIAEPMSGRRTEARVADAYFGIYLLAMGSGKPRTPRQLLRLLETAGFRQFQMRPTGLPMFARVLTARRVAANISVKPS